jgi:hypothetical protein
MEQEFAEKVMRDIAKEKFERLDSVCRIVFQKKGKHR